jgi:glucose/arabinose dehydrogenase
VEGGQLHRRAWVRALVVVMLTGVALGPQGSNAVAHPLPDGFQEQIVIAGLTKPTNLEFAPDGRIFVAEKRGVIKVYDGPTDTTPTVFADLTNNVNAYWDRGLLGLTLAPTFPADPWVYVAYTYDAPPGQGAPVYQDVCPFPISAGACTVTARLSRLQAAGDHWTGSEHVLVHDWCQQFPSHSIGDLRFGPDGALYVSAGDGASFNAVDYGQLPVGGANNSCGDPPGGVMSLPGAQGGALRAQDLRTTADPTGLSGAILRLDPSTGAAMAGNPLIGSSDPNNRRIVAYGLRNPYRFAIRPGTDEVWVGDVGHSTYEEIDAFSPSAPVENFGWPCYEAGHRHTGYDAADLSLCESLYTGGGHTQPRLEWHHAAPLHPGDECLPTANSAVTGMAFYPANGGPYPSTYRSALFFADYSRGCIWAMKAPAPGAAPSPSTVEQFAINATAPVDLAVGPGDELYYVDITGGTVRRFRYFSANQPPTASLAASPANGGLPLVVHLDASGSTDPDPADEDLVFEWDFEDDGTIDLTGPAVVDHTYAAAGTYTARVIVTDTLGATGTTTRIITPGNDLPTAVINTPSASTLWRVGQNISFSGTGVDPDDGTLPASALDWQLRMQHCGTPTSCHAHTVESWDGVGSGSFVAPDHEYPSYLELVLTATDSGGLSHTVVRRLDPRTVDLTFATSPPGLGLVVNSVAGTGPFTRTVIQGSGVTVSAGTPQISGGTTYDFVSWSDSGARTHVLSAPLNGTPVTYTAGFAEAQVVNLALNRPTTSSGRCTAAQGPANAVNGTTAGGVNGRWCGPGPTAWLRVDLGSVRPVTGIVIRHAGAGGEPAASNTRDYSVQISATGATWRTLVAQTGNTANVTTHPVAGSGRYLRLNVTAPASDATTTARVYELEVLGPPNQAPVLAGTNVALNRPVTASGQCAATSGPVKAVNGTVAGGTADRWCANGAGGWLQVDLGSPRSISGMVVRHASAGGETAGWNTRDFTLEVSDDQVTWTTVATVTGNTAGVTLHPMNTTGRYVRINVTTPASNGSTTIRIFEMEVLSPP